MPQPDARENLIEHYIKGKTVLDLGAGDIGHRFLHRFVHQTAKHSTALELYPNRATELRKLGYHVVTADAQNFSLGQTFDVIIAGDLIEHLTNLDGFFTSVGHHLQKDGLFIINTPNMYSINLILRGAVGKYGDYLEHTIGFDEKLLIQTIERYPAFRIKELIYFNHPVGGIRGNLIALAGLVSYRLKENILVVLEKV